LDALYDKGLKATLDCWMQTPEIRVMMAYESSGWRFVIVRLDTSSGTPVHAVKAGSGTPQHLQETGQA